MIAEERLHRPSDALPADDPSVAERTLATDDSRGRVGGRSRSPLAREFACALGGGAALLMLTVLLHLLAAWLGLGTDVAAHGEQFAGLFLAGALGTFVVRELVVRPR